MATLSECPIESLDNMPGLGEHPLIIADSLLPPVLRHPTLVVSSPGRLVNRELKDTLNSYWDQRFYMPLPTTAEIWDMQAVAFPHLDRAGVERRLGLWGPVPRYVLVKVDPEQQVQLWLDAESVQLDTLAALARGHVGLGGERDAPYRLVHARAAGQDAEPGSRVADPSNAAFYRRGRVAIASLPMLRHIVTTLKRTQAWHAAFLVDASLGIGDLGSLHGLKFENIVCALLEEGLTLPCRDLHDDSTSTLTIRATPRAIWSDPAELEKLRGSPRLLVPRDRNEAGLDALLWDEHAAHHWPLDCTVSASHGLHAQGLAHAVKALGWTPEGGWPRKTGPGNQNRAPRIKYYWAVPEDRFNRGWSEPQHPKKGTDGSLLARATFERVHQYALSIPPAQTIARVAKVCEQEGVPLPGRLLEEIVEAS